MAWLLLGLVTIDQQNNSQAPRNPMRRPERRSRQSWAFKTKIKIQKRKKEEKLYGSKVQPYRITVAITVYWLWVFGGGIVHRMWLVGKTGTLWLWRDYWTWGRRRQLPFTDDDPIRYFKLDAMWWTNGVQSMVDIPLLWITKAAAV
jgi:hypothetical protein